MSLFEEWEAGFDQVSDAGVLVDLTDPNFDLIGWRCATVAGELVVTGTCSWSANYVDVTVAGHPTCRSAALVRARMRLRIPS